MGHKHRISVLLSPAFMSEMAAIPTEFCAPQRKSLSANYGLMQRSKERSLNNRFSCAPDNDRLPRTHYGTGMPRRDFIVAASLRSKSLRPALKTAS
jgi:hypothetical protein